MHAGNRPGGLLALCVHGLDDPSHVKKHPQVVNRYSPDPYAASLAVFIFLQSPIGNVSMVDCMLVHNLQRHPYLGFWQGVNAEFFRLTVLGGNIIVGAASSHDQ